MLVGPEVLFVNLLKGIAFAVALLVLVMCALYVRLLWRRTAQRWRLLGLAGFATLVALADVIPAMAGFADIGFDSFAWAAVVRLGAYVSLMGFVWSRTGRETKANRLRIMGVVLVVIAASTHLWMPEWAELAARIGPGLLAALVAAYVLWHQADKEPEASLWLRGISLLLVSYAATEAFALPIAQIAGLVPLRPAELFSTWGTVVLVAAALLNTLLGLGIAIYLFVTAGDTADHRQVRERVVRVGIIGTVIVILGIGIVETITVGQRYREAYDEELAKRVSVSAYFLRSTSAPQDYEQSGAVAAHLKVIEQTTEDVRVSYVARVTEDSMDVFLTSTGPDADDPPCSVEPADVFAALREGDIIVGEALEPTAEGCVTVIAPLKRDVSGSYIAFGQVIDVSGRVRTLTAIMVAGYGLTGFLALLAIGLYQLGVVKRASDERLRTSEARFREIFESAPGPALLVGAVERDIHDANQAAQEWLGRTRGELLAKCLDDIEGESAESLDVLFRRARRDDHAVSAFREVVLLDGERRKAEFRIGMTVLDGDHMAIVFARDTTAQRMLEDTLTSHATTQRVVADVATDLVTVTPERFDAVVEEYLGRIGHHIDAQRVSLFRRTDSSAIPFKVTHQWVGPDVEPLDHVAHMRGQDDSCWLAERILETETVLVVSHDDAEASAPALHAAMDAGGTDTFLVIPLAFGEDVLGFVGIDSGRGKYGYHDDEIGLLKTVADMLSTGIVRLRAQGELAELSQALEQSPVSVIITDADGEIRWTNPMFTELNGYTFEEARGQNPRLLKSGMVDDAAYEDLWKTILAGGTWRGELANRRQDGTLWWAELTVSSLVDASDQIVAFVGVQQDVTATKEVEQTLQVAKSAAEEANRAKSEFLATMSHEIRTPMNAIIGMSELLTETQLDTDQDRYVRTLAAAGEALLDLIDDVLDLSKIEAGRVDLEAIPFDPAILAEEVAEVIAVRVRELPVEVLVHVADDVPRAVAGDRHRLRQVLLNLLGNAVKFTTEGHVLLEVHRDTAFDIADRIRLRFEVADTGIGIPKDKQGRIFDAFAQADSSTTREYGGTGLGLAISKKIVEAMGGNIGVRSKEGKGSTFAFTAVFDVSSRDEPLAPRIPDVDDIADARILVVDDNDVNRMIVKDYLAPIDAVLDEVVSGEDALSVLRSGQRQYDLILLDVRMPGIDGFETARIVREDHLGGNPSIVILTSEDEPGDRDRVRSLRLEGRLLKPMRRTHLIEAVQQAVGAARARSSEQPEQTAQKEPQPEPEEAVAADEPQNLRILLVEDSEDNRFLIQAFLGDSSHSLDIAVNGQDAVDAYEKAGDGAFDLVFMDMQMPVMDGYDATRTIRAMEIEREWPRTPITALTAYALEEEVQKSLAAGCDHHLTKPIRKAQLLEAIRTHSRR